LDDKGGLLYRDWVTITEQLKPFRLARAIGGTMYFTGILVMIYNFIKTMGTKDSGFEETDLRVGVRG
jgi:cytochrome c oxidase cbb3-type subunit 1